MKSKGTHYDYAGKQELEKARNFVYWESIMGGKSHTYKGEQESRFPTAHNHAHTPGKRDNHQGIVMHSSRGFRRVRN